MTSPTGVVRRHRFAAGDEHHPARLTAAIDMAAFIASLQAALTATIGLPCRVEADPNPTAPRTGSGEIDWHYALDGSWLGVALSITLAEALVSLRCGGGLTGAGGALGGTASVVRQQADLMAMLLRAAARSWLTSDAEWIAAASASAVPPSPPSTHALTIAVGGFSCTLSVIAVVTHPAQAAVIPAHWTQQLRRAIDHVAFPVRATLFETSLPLARAAQLRPGDVLPIEAPREVGLRVGSHRLAAGTIAPTGDGGHVVTIRASARSFRSAASEQVPL